MHPLFEEICRARPDNIRPDVFRRWQNQLRSEIQPKLDELDALNATAPEPMPESDEKAAKKGRAA